MGGAWRADESAIPVRQVKSPEELGTTSGRTERPDLRVLDNGDVATVGQDLTASHRDRLPKGGRIADDERLVVPAGATMPAAKAGLADA